MRRPAASSSENLLPLHRQSNGRPSGGSAESKYHTAPQYSRLIRPARLMLWFVAGICLAELLLVEALLYTLNYPSVRSLTQASLDELRRESEIHERNPWGRRTQADQARISATLSAVFNQPHVDSADEELVDAFELWIHRLGSPDLPSGKVLLANMKSWMLSGMPTPPQEPPIDFTVSKETAGNSPGSHTFALVNRTAEKDLYLLDHPPGAAVSEIGLPSDTSQAEPHFIPDSLRKAISGRYKRAAEARKKRPATEANCEQASSTPSFAKRYGERRDPQKIATIGEKREFIKSMMQHAWRGYAECAWGHSEVKPNSCGSIDPSLFGSAATGASIVDALDTLLIMGMKEEYEQARNWVACQFHFPNSNVKELSVFEVNIRYVGGFLAAYALSGDRIFVEKAQDLVDTLLPAFDTASGIPKSLYDPNTGRTRNYGWGSQNAILAEFGTLDLEFQYLSDITGEEVYRDLIANIRDLMLKRVRDAGGFLPAYYKDSDRTWVNNAPMSLNGLSDSAYEYFLKAWIIDGRSVQHGRSLASDTSWQAATASAEDEASEECVFVGPYEGFYLSEYATGWKSGDGSQSLEYTLSWCAANPTCNGVTTEGEGNRRYSARKGRILRVSPNDEKSYILDSTLPCGQRRVYPRPVLNETSSASRRQNDQDAKGATSNDDSVAADTRAALESLELYTTTAQYIKQRLIKEEDDYMFVGSTTKPLVMDHLACFSGGMFALGAHTSVYGEGDAANEADLLVGEKLTTACRHAYKTSPTGIGPEQMTFNPFRPGPGKQYLLRPETVESYMLLWRITKNEMYRDWAWDAALAIEEHCRADFGYTNLKDVTVSGSLRKDDSQPSYFLAETLKYLYLTFCDEDTISLDAFVFNTEAHTLPIKTKRRADGASVYAGLYVPK